MYKIVGPFFTLYLSNIYLLLIYLSIIYQSVYHLSSVCVSVHTHVQYVCMLIFGVHASVDQRVTLGK